MLGGQVVRCVLWDVLDDSADGHGAQPLAHVTLVEVGRRSDLLGGGGGHPRHDVEEARPASDRRHQRERSIVEDADHPLGERFGLCLV